SRGRQRDHFLVKQRRTRLFRLSLFLGLALLAGCASLTPEEKADAEREALARDVKDEIEIGRKMAAKLLGHLGEYKGSPSASAYVDLVGGVLAAKVGRPEITFHFGVLDTENVNAFATPGGYVFVT